MTLTTESLIVCPMEKTKYLAVVAVVAFSSLSQPPIVNRIAEAGNAIASSIPKKEPMTKEELDRVAKVALSNVGTDYKMGESARCADWVRFVYEKSGYKLPVSKKPIDSQQPVNPETANSLIGEDIGVVIKDPDYLRPGDIVSWANTYGNWTEGTITHVGIYLGKGVVADRPTKHGTVLKRKLWEVKGDFVAGVRPIL
jgi:cell wall-associated NlpC family hydrolase